VLLALDHSRQEPWGSRHGVAFAAFALQHPARYATSLDPAWATLHRMQGECRRLGSYHCAGGREIVKRTWTIIGVSDVPSSFKWYQSLFGQPTRRPEHAYFGQILDSDGTVLLCLHQWGAHDHPSLMSRDRATPGNGLLLFFRVDDFDASLKRARGLVARLEEEPHANPNTQTQEFSLRDPDGYYVTISSLT
jgi:catechol 2,3-dioxygenase-like lactoylglutathione lyase family enzyme